MVVNSFQVFIKFCLHIEYIFFFYYLLKLKHVYLLHIYYIENTFLTLLSSTETFIPIPPLEHLEHSSKPCEPTVRCTLPYRYCV